MDAASQHSTSLYEYCSTTNKYKLLVHVVQVLLEVVAKESRRGWLCQHIHTWRILFSKRYEVKVIIDSEDTIRNTQSS